MAQVNAYKNHKIIKKVIKGRPTVQYYVQLFRGDDISQKNSYSNQYKVKYITYLHSEQFKHFRSTQVAMEGFLRESKFLSMNLNWEQVTTHEK